MSSSEAWHRAGNKLRSSLDAARRMAIAAGLISAALGGLLGQSLFATFAGAIVGLLFGAVVTLAPLAIMGLIIGFLMSFIVALTFSLPLWTAFCVAGLGMLVGTFMEVRSYFAKT